MKKILFILLTLITSISYSQCDIQASICTPGTAGPFNFVPTGGPYAGGSFVNAGCATGAGGNHSYGFITLYITQSGPLNLLINGSAVTGFIDVAIFNIPPGTNPCDAVLSGANAIGCNFANVAGGCVQFGTVFPCGSSVPAPNVMAGQQIMIIAQNWSTPGSTSFNLELGPLPGAQTGPPNATITQVGPFCENDGTIQLNAVNMGGTWVGTGVSPTGLFNPSTAGVGTHTINYTIGSNPCMSQDQVNIVVNAIYNSTINDILCSGTSYTFPNGSVQVINSNTTQVSTLTSLNGCDSIITTNLTISNSSNNSIVNSSICVGGSYTFPDGTVQVINSNTTQVSTLVGGSVNGCDSIITTNITITPSVTSTQNISVCNGTTVTFPDGSSQVIVGSVAQVSTLVGGSVAGCDSIITTNVSLLPNPTSTVNVSVCSGDSYTFPDATVNPSVTVPVTQVSTLVGAGANGCDSIVTTNISVDPIYNLVNNVSICEGDNYTFPDGSIQVGIVVPVTQISNLVSTNGCDSIITTNISINPIYNIVQNVSVCSGDSYTYPDGTIQSSITTPVAYISNLSNINGCDSIIITNVSVNPVYNIVQNVSVCNGYNYTFPDGFVQVGIIAPMSHTSNLLTTENCDSIIITSVSVFASYTSTTNIDICSGSGYTFADGTTQTNIITPTTYVSTLISIDGCDSLVTENISVNPVYNLVENFNQCPGNDYTFPDGTTITNINNNISHISNLLTSDGCDSVITTNINIYYVPPFDVTFTPNGCPLLDMTMTNNTTGVGCNWSVSGPGTLQNYTGCGSITDTYSNSGFYNVTLTMTSLDGCPMDTIITNAFHVYPEPLAQFTWSPNEGNLITNNTISFTNTSIGSTSYSWSFGDGSYSNMYSISHTYQDTGHYQVQLVVSNGFGCSDTVIGVIIINQEFFIFVPNAFTPDGDAHNNTFKPIVSGHDPQNYTLYIFNRWGEILFESHNSEFGWDGSYNNAVCKSDVYVWKVQVRTFDGLRKEYLGHVTLLR